MGITMFVINVVLRERELISESNEQTKIHKDNFLLRNLYSKNYFNSSFCDISDNEQITNKNLKTNDNHLYKNDFVNQHFNKTSDGSNPNKEERNFIFKKGNKYSLIISSLKKELNNDFKLTLIFYIRCFLGTFAEIFLFFSFKDLRINTATTLYTIYPIISSVLSFLYINTSQKNSKFKDFTFLILCVIFVSFVTKPDFIFGESNDLNKKDGVNGFINITLSILCNAIAIFAHKKIANNFNNYTFNIFFGINFILFSFFLMILDKFTILHLDIFTLLMLFLMSILFNINQTLFNLSTKLGDLVVILPITYLCIVLGFINNIIFFNGAWDYLDLLGSFGIIFINVCRIIFTFNEE